MSIHLTEVALENIEWALCPLLAVSRHYRENSTNDWR